MILMIWCWMSNESLRLFCILDSFFFILLHKFGSAGYFIPLAKTNFVLFLLLFCRIGYLANNNKKQSHGKLSAALLQFCTLGWSLKT